jgi:hypothetical protein
MASLAANSDRFTEPWQASGSATRKRFTQLGKCLFCQSSFRSASALHTSPHQAGLSAISRDGKKERPVEPGSFPLVDGFSAGLGRVRAYGNSICAPQAQAFIEAVKECVTCEQAPMLVLPTFSSPFFGRDPG